MIAPLVQGTLDNNSYLDWGVVSCFELRYVPVLNGSDGILRDVVLVELVHVLMDGGVVAAHRRLRVAVRQRAESQTRLRPEGIAYLRENSHDSVAFPMKYGMLVPYPRVVNPAEVVVLLSGYHEGRQVRRVHGEEDDGKQRPDAAHEPT